MRRDEEVHEPENRLEAEAWLSKARLRDLASRAERLTPFAWVFRYPGDDEQPTEAEARDALDLARLVFDAARGRVL